LEKTLKLTPLIKSIEVEDKRAPKIHNPDIYNLSVDTPPSAVEVLKKKKASEKSKKSFETKTRAKSNDFNDGKLVCTLSMP